MSYKIVRIAGLHYFSPKELFYQKYPGIENRPYQEQQKALFQESYVYSDSFSRTMREMGADAHEIVYDLKPLQISWAQENSIQFSKKNWQIEILLAQIEKLRPHVLFFQDIHSLSFGIRKDLKKRFPFLKVIAIFRGFPQIDEQLLTELSHADVLFVGSPILEEKCKAAGLNPVLVHHYFDETLLKRVKDRFPDAFEAKHNFTFIGSSGFRYGLAHQPRFEALLTLAEKTHLELWIDELLTMERFFSWEKWKAYTKRFLRSFFERFSYSQLDFLHRNLFLPQKVQKLLGETLIEKKQAIKSPQIPLKPLYKLLPERCHPPVFGLDMFYLLSQSKITFNKHSKPAEDTVDNIRMFQATGMGCCLLTDRGRNLPELFEEDREVVAYSSLEEAIEKVKYLLSHEEERKEIARRGQQKVLEAHTAIHRAQIFHKKILEALEK